MNEQEQDIRSLSLRIAMLEEQNRRIKRIVAGAFLLLGSAAFGVLAAGGQQKLGNEQSSGGQKLPLQSSSWKLADGRLVVFPPSVKKVEDVDATTLNLPLGTRVVGWEPVDGATSLLPGYDQRIATIPTTKGKMDALANAAGILQAQVNELRVIKAEHADVAGVWQALDGHTELANQVSQIGALAAYDDSRIVAMQFSISEVDDLKRKLDDFKDAACPVLRTARVDWTTRMKLDSECGLR